MLTPDTYNKFKEKFRELDRVFDTVVEKGVRVGGTVYIARKILSPYPQEYLDYYMTTRNIFITSMHDERLCNRRAPVRDSVINMAKRYNAITRYAKACAEGET